MLEQIRQSIEQAQMVLVGIGTEFAVKEEAQEDPFFTELAKTAQTDPAAAALLAFHKSQKKVGGCEKEQVQKAYEVLADLLKDKNYFVISLCEDGLLEQAGLKESDVKLLDLEPNDIHAAWKRGDIDAAYVWYPVLNNLVKDGKILTGSDKLAKQGIITADLVVARRDFAKSNKNLVVRYIKALNQANDLDQKNKEQSIKDIAEILNISESDAKFQRNGFEWIDGKKQLSKEYLGENIANVLKNTADFLKEQGSIKKSPTLKEYKDHVQTKYLKEALEK